MSGNQKFNISTDKSLFIHFPNNLSYTVDFTSKPNLNFTILSGKNLEYNLTYIEAKFDAKNKKRITVEISIKSNKPLIVTYKETTRPIMVSADKILIKTVSKKYFIEAPAYCTVVGEEGNLTNGLTIHYRTAGLNITKTILIHKNNVSVKYQAVLTKENFVLQDVSLNFWLNGRKILNYKVENNSIKILTDIGNLDLEVNIQKGPPNNIRWNFSKTEPSFHVFISTGISKVIVLKLMFKIKNLEVTYHKTTRPTMESSDILVLASNRNLFTKIFETENYSILRVKGDI